MELLAKLYDICHKKQLPLGESSRKKLIAIQNWSVRKFLEEETVHCLEKPRVFFAI